MIGFLNWLDGILWGLPLIVLMIATGLYFTIRSGFFQFRYIGWIFKRTLGQMSKKNQDTAEEGKGMLSSFEAISTAIGGTVGFGNIAGVATAVAAGGPGALFWMWLSAFFGMSTAYTEAVMSQMFKEKKDDDFVGGLPYYGKKLLGNKKGAGIFLSVMFIVYAMCCLPAQGFNVVSSIGQMGEILTGSAISTTSPLYYITAAVLILLVAYLAFGGIKKVTKVTDTAVPVMAVIYIVTVDRKSVV